MNWTGGRLQRHSKDPNTLQKQRFAKLRPRKADDAQVPEIFQSLSRFHVPKSQQRTVSGGPDPQDQISKNLHGLSNTSACTRNRPSQALSRLDRIKRQLLGTNDWAAIGATRPIKMSFTPTEELERFGKRRKLTEADHNRLFSSGARISRQGPRERTRERAPSELGSIGNVDIQIYQPRDNPEFLSTDYDKSSHESSQPMLLDREEAHSVQHSPSPDGGVYGSSRGLISSQLLLSSQNLSRKSPSLASSDIVLPVESVSQANDQQYTDRSSPQYLSSRSPTRLDSRTPSLHQPIPQLPRRFTIDDQIAAELEAQSSRGIWDDHAQPHHSDTASRYAKSKCSSEKIRNEHGLGFAASGTRSTSSNQFSGWLPEPKHHIQRFVGQNDSQTNMSSTVTMLDEVYHGQPTSDADLGLRVKATGSYTSPVRIFGQSAGLDETIEDTQNPQRPVYNTNPRFVPPQGYMTPNPQHARIQEDINPERYMLNGFVNKAVDQAFSDRPRRDFQIYGDTPFTPFCQRISRQPDLSNMNLVDDVVQQQTVYGQYLPTSTSSKQEATDNRQRYIATSSPNSFSMDRTYRKPFEFFGRLGCELP